MKKLLFFVALTCFSMHVYADAEQIDTIPGDGILVTTEEQSEDEVGIKDVRMVEDNYTFYDLNGIKFNDNNYKGVAIINRKKVLIK